MNEYLYKGMNIAYMVTAAHPFGFQADGYITRKNDPNTPLQNFQTESKTAVDAEREIRKLMENYLDFEFDQFIEVQKDL